jgi:predicted dehydrogenase
MRICATDGGNIGGITDRFLRVYPAAGPSETIAVQPVDPWAAEIAYFAERVEQGRPPGRGTAAQARDALMVSLAVNRSLRSGRPEPVG